MKSDCRGARMNYEIISLDEKFDDNLILDYLRRQQYAQESGEIYRHFKGVLGERALRYHLERLLKAEKVGAIKCHKEHGGRTRVWRCVE
jgi:hypothetical protein